MYYHELQNTKMHFLSWKKFQDLLNRILLEQQKHYVKLFQTRKINYFFYMILKNLS